MTTTTTTPISSSDAFLGTIQTLNAMSLATLQTEINVAELRKQIPGDLTQFDTNLDALLAFRNKSNQTEEIKPQTYTKLMACAAFSGLLVGTRSKLGIVAAIPLIALAATPTFKGFKGTEEILEQIGKVPGKLQDKANSILEHVEKYPTFYTYASAALAGIGITATVLAKYKQ